MTGSTDLDVRTSSADRAGATGRTRPSRRRRAAGVLLTVLAVALVWVALAAPAPAIGWSASLLTLARVPAEAVVLVGALLVLRGSVRRWFAVLVGVVLGLLLVVRILDAAFIATLYRTFNPLTDWRYAGSAKDLLGDSTGPVAAAGIVAAACALLLGVVVVMPFAVRRVARLVDRHRRGASWAVVAGAVAWVVLAATGLGRSPDLPAASASAAGLAVREVTSVRDGLHDRDVFAARIPEDPFHDTPSTQLLNGLRGKDVVIVFVESYGKVAVDRSPDVARALSEGTTSLTAAGWSTRSAWLTSPTFGGISWLAHSTLQSGLWVSSQQRYDQLLDTAASERRRLTLAGAFARAGWRTVDVIPANRRDWPEGTAFYGYDAVYDARTLGYSGPGFGYAPMPDQFTLAAFDRLELDRRPPGGRAPVMAEVDLVTSHVPWAPLPEIVPWEKVGDGSVFLEQAGHATPREVVWSSPERVRTAYGQTVAYSLDSVVSFLRGTRDDDLVVVLLGDHQPVSIVSGEGASHDVPVSILTRDPAVLDRVAPWQWSDGLRPPPAAPVWTMDRFRDRFLTAFGPRPGG